MRKSLLLIFMLITLAACVTTNPPVATDNQFLYEDYKIDINIPDGLDRVGPLAFDRQDLPEGFQTYTAYPYINTDTTGKIQKGLIIQVATTRQNYSWNAPDAESYDNWSLGGGSARISKKLFYTGIATRRYIPEPIIPLLEKRSINLEEGPVIAKVYSSSVGRSRFIKISYMEAIDTKMQERLRTWADTRNSGIGFKMFNHHPDSMEYVPDHELADFVNAFEVRADRAISAIESERFKSVDRR